MLVCPTCREVNPEGAAVCEHCGGQLRVSLATRGRRSAPPAIDVPIRKQSPRWVPITVFSVIVVGAAALVVWLLVRPQACDGKFSSSQFAYCVAVPRGWSASTATIGSVQVDQFAHRGSVAVVMSIPLRPGVTVATYAGIARAQAQQRGLQSGAARPVRLGGRPAYEWDVSDLAQQTFRGVEVATVVGGVGWTVQLDDDVTTSGQDAAPFRSMLASWHFR